MNGATCENPAGEGVWGGRAIWQPERFPEPPRSNAAFSLARGAPWRQVGRCRGRCARHGQTDSQSLAFLRIDSDRGRIVSPTVATRTSRGAAARIPRRHSENLIAFTQYRGIIQLWDASSTLVHLFCTFRASQEGHACLIHRVGIAEIRWSLASGRESPASFLLPTSLFLSATTPPGWRSPSLAGRFFVALRRDVPGYKSRKGSIAAPFLTIYGGRRLSRDHPVPGTLP
jgi:hypothetical protein